MIMKSRLFFFTPKGPLCFIDYSSIMEGRAILNRIRKVVGPAQQSHNYQFKLFRKIKNRFVSIDEHFLSGFDRDCLDVFVESAFSARYKC